jgi:hypothetical protein
MNPIIVAFERKSIIKPSLRKSSNKTISKYEIINSITYQMGFQSIYQIKKKKKITLNILKKQEGGGGGGGGGCHGWETLIPVQEKQ